MKHPAWFKVRGALQALAWLLFIWVLIYTRDPLEGNPFYNLFPRLSIHLGIGASLAARKLITAFFPALLLLGLTLLLGRFFCSTLCPLGATIDATDRLFSRAGKNRLAGAKGSRRDISKYKYLVLGFSLVLALAGVQAAGIIDPLSLAVRSYATAVYPYFDYLAKGFLSALSRVPVINVIADPFASYLKDTVLDFNRPLYTHHPAMFLFFLLPLALSAVSRRFWCRALCPLGASLALAGRCGMLKRRVNAEKCTRCMACVKRCRMNAIHSQGEGTDYGECVQCFECLKSCEYDAISFQPGVPFKREKSSPAPPGTERGGRISRRDIIGGALASLAAVPLFKLNPTYKNDHSWLIRPPGAQAESAFTAACVRCGVCMKACPTNGLHPALLEAGLEGAFTPRLVPRIGWCEKNCTLCTQVCPSGALRRLELHQKETEVIGTAVIDRDLCIPWSEGRNCIVCEEVCPTVTKSIKFRDERVLNKKGVRTAVKLPFVLEEVCIGCGICENKCPVGGSSAIRVRARKSGPAAGGQAGAV